MSTTLEHRGSAASWTPVALIGVAFAITVLGATLPTPLYPLYSAQFGFGEFVTTLIFATYAVGVVAGLLLFGHWSDQLGRRPVLLAGLGLSGVSAAAFLVPGSLFWLFLGRLLSGLSAGIFTGTATAAIIDLAPGHARGRAGLVAGAVNVGGLGLGPVLAGVLAQYAPGPTRLCFVVDLALVAVGLGLVLRGPEPVTRSASLRLRPRRLSVPEQARGVFVRASLAGFAGFAVLGLITAVSPAFLGTVVHEHNRAAVGVIVFLVFAASVAGQAATERLGLDLALQAGCAALIAGLVVLAISLPRHSLILLIVGAVIAGFGHGTSFRAGLGSVAAASPDDRRGEITSTLFLLLYIGISIPVVGVGALTVAFGLVTAGVAFAIVVSLVAAVALGLLVRAARA